MAGDTLIERWTNDEDPVETVPAPKKDPDPLAWASLVPTNMNGDVPEDVRKAERAIVLEWLEGLLRPTHSVTPYILAYVQYIRQGPLPKVDFNPAIDLAEFLPMKKTTV